MRVRVKDNLDGVMGVNDLSESADETVGEGTYRHLGIEGGLKNFLELLFADELSEGARDPRCLQ